MSVKAISTNNTQQNFPLQGTNFGDLIDELEDSQSKFQDFQFFLDGVLLQKIAKGTRIQTICSGGTIQIYRKDNPSKILTTPAIIQNNPLPPPSIDQNNTQVPQDIWATQPTINDPPSQAPIGNINNSAIYHQPNKPNVPANGPFIGISGVVNSNPVPHKIAPQPSTFVPPPSTFVPQPSTFVPSFPVMPPVSSIPQNVNLIIPPNQPLIQPPPAITSLRKEVKYKAQINDEQKFINDYRVKITDKGNKVELENEKYDMKAVFLEENANEKIQAEIKSQLTKDLYAQDIKLVVKCLVGEQNQSTKVIFKKNLDGVAIQWATGLVTLFDFDLAI